MDSIDMDRSPLNGTFELTARCNLQCKMCLIRIDEKRMQELGGRERTTKEWIHMAQEAEEAGTIGLLLTGGEPMLRSDFIGLYQEIVKMGFIITLYTNATLINKEIREILSKYPPHKIGVTVYGASQETYKRVTGNANAYLQMIEGLDFLRKLPSQLQVRTTIIKDNINDLDQIANLASGLYAEFSISRIVTKPVRGGIAKVEDCRLTPEQSVAMFHDRNRKEIVDPFYKFADENPDLMLTDIGTLESHACVAQEFEGMTVQKAHKRTLYGCEAGMTSYCITWDGKLIGCQMLGDCWTDPFTNTFKKAWNDFPNIMKHPEKPRECESCRTGCSACPATRLAETGRLDGFSEYLCRESKLSHVMEESLLSEIQQRIKREDR